MKNNDKKYKIVASYVPMKIARKIKEKSEKLNISESCLVKKIVEDFFEKEVLKKKKERVYAQR